VVEGKVKDVVAYVMCILQILNSFIIIVESGDELERLAAVH